MALADSTNPMQGVSGPGQFSKRTDLQYQSDSYGDGVAMDALKAGAPLDKSAPSPRATPTEVRQAAMQNPGSQAPATDMYGVSNRPEEPITHGVDIGPGAGSNVLAMQKSAVKLSDTLAQMLPYDTTGEIGVLYQRALSRGM